MMMIGEDYLTYVHVHVHEQEQVWLFTGEILEMSY